MKRGLGVAALVVAMILALVGILAVKWYVWDIAIGESGEADRSMLFWGLPILFLGIFMAAAAFGMAALARRAFRSPR